MTRNYVPIARVDVYFSRARRFCTLEGTQWPKPLAFNHLEQVLGFLTGEGLTQVLLVAGDYEVLIDLPGAEEGMLMGRAQYAPPTNKPDNGAREAQGG